MEQTIEIDSFYFEYVEDCELYQCKGKLMYDEEHDETPEPELWEAAIKLSKQLATDGSLWEVEHSEKGWVNVCRVYHR